MGKTYSYDDDDAVFDDADDMNFKQSLYQGKQKQANKRKQLKRRIDNPHAHKRARRDDFDSLYGG